MRTTGSSIYSKNNGRIENLEEGKEKGKFKRKHHFCVTHKRSALVQDHIKARVQPPPLSKVTPHGSTHMYYTVDLIEHPNSEADSAKINCNYILVVSENAFMSRKWLLD